MIDGLILGALTWISFVASFVHLPSQAKAFFLKNFFLTDVLSVVLSFFLLTNISKSIVAVIAAMLCGLLVNLTLMFHRQFF